MSDTAPNANATVDAPDISEYEFRHRNYAPVQREVTATSLEVTGTIPDYLDGRFVRNGPNPVRDVAGSEWIFGSGMVHGLRVRDGKAEWYRNRWVRSAEVCRALGERWMGGPYKGGFDFGGNTNIVGFNGRLLALAEGGTRPYEMDGDLDTIGPSDFCGTLRGGYSGHPKLDPVTGELHSISYRLIGGNSVRYTVTGIDGRVRHQTDIPMQRNVMMHDFAMTEKYVLVFDLPVVLDVAAMAKTGPTRLGGSMLTKYMSQHALPGPLAAMSMRGSHLRRRGFKVPYRWDPGHRARVGVLPRNGVASQIRWFEVQPCFVFHALNAYDDGDRVVTEVLRYERSFADSPAPFPVSPTLDRWTIDLVTGQVREERLDDRFEEFPRVDERLVGRRHRYGYTISYDQDAEVTPDSLIKRDMQSNALQARAFGAGREPSEFVFVPSSADSGEDEGVVMGFVYNRASDLSDLVMLDAQTLEEVATVHLPARVPHGLHGNWVSDGV